MSRHYPSPTGYDLTLATFNDMTKRTARELRMARTLNRPAVVDRLPDGTPYGQPEGMIFNPNEFHASLHASLHILTKDIGELLYRRFPGFLWAVQPDGNGHIINVFCLNFHDQWGYTIRVAEIQDDPKRTLAIDAAKTLLALFRYPGFRYDHALAAALPRGSDGKVIPDPSQMPASHKRWKDRAIVEQAIAEGRADYIGDVDDGRRIIQVRH